MSGPRILFLPDYGASVGGGHVMRCLTVAAELRRRGATCGFSVLPEAQQVIRRFGADIEIVGRDWPADVAVVDGYDYTAADEAALAARGLKVAAFDDILRAHDCDLVIDSGLGRTAADYPGRARVLAGVDYCPIRAEFTERRPASLARRNGAGEGRVLVSLGLTDVGGVTARVLDLLKAALGWKTLDVVLGAGAQSLSAVQAAAAADSRIRLHIDARNMAQLCEAADFAVGAGGVSQWERACLGLPTLVLILAPNQAPGAVQQADLGAALALDVTAPGFDDQFTAAFDRLATDADLRRSISQTAAALCDGQGAARVADAILAL